MSRYMELREQWPEFVYEGYYIEETEADVRIRYRFRISGLSDFEPEWKFPKDLAFRWSFRDDPTFRRIIFSLGMVELISYWKICCSPVVWVEAGCLDREQIRWWKDLYYNGLGEFFYTNRIQEADPNTFMDIRCRVPEQRAAKGAESGRADRMHGASDCETAGHEASGYVAERLQNRAESRDDGKDTGAGSLPPLEGCLIPVGGGKDSAVTIELVRKTGLSSKTFVVNPRGATVQCSRAGGYGPDREVAVSRTLDPNMLRLNREGYLNGHTPFSAIVAFSSVAAAYMHRLSCVTLSNESSANESTVPGSTVNHQYSKSFKFESDFNDYERRYLCSGVSYFSLLRPLSEFQIARYFSGLSRYHSVFRSCNVGSKQDVWCGHCPKCLFVCLILSPFLSQEELRKIFGADLLNDSSLTGTLEQLVGIQEEKPFECVGSRDEVNAAIALTIERMERDGEALPVLLRYYRQTDLYRTSACRDHGYFTYYDDENLLPEPFEKVLRQECLPADQ